MDISGARSGTANVAERIDALLRAAIARLQPVHPDSAQLDAQLLLAHVAAMNRASLMAFGERTLEQHDVQRLHALLARRCAGEPVAYLLGEREFWSLTLRVTPDVLVPRPETELLVERALALLGPQPADVADLGTGSGAIALALAHERPLWRVHASDASPAALAIARDNAQRLNLPVEFHLGDWCAALRNAVRFAAILSNPPYIDEADPALPALAAEPRDALVAADRGIAALRTIIRDAPAHLRDGGWLLLEHGATQAREVAALLVGRGFARVRSHRDPAGLDRITEARWAPRAEDPT